MKPQPSLRALASFVAVAEDLHFGRAAARLEISQPSLSHHVQSLEAVLGVSLFRRTRRTVQITAAGQAILPDARLLLAQVERMRTRAQRIADGEAGELRLGFVASGAYALLPALVRRFRRRCPHAQIVLDECGLRVPIEQLEAGTLDLAVVRGPISHPTLRVEILLRERLCAVLPAGHRLTRRRPLLASSLAGERFALFPRHRAPAFHAAILDYCRAAGFAPRLEHEAADWQVLASLVAAGLAVTVAPESVRLAPRAGLCYRTLEPPAMIAELDLLHGRMPSPLADAFVQVAHATAAALTARGWGSLASADRHPPDAHRG